MVKQLHLNIIIIVATLIIIVVFRNKSTPATMTFPPTLVINLNKDTDRLKTIKKDFESAGWPVPLERVEAVERKPGYIGCTLSHIKCMKLALERNYEWTLIIEDDCLLKPGARDRFIALLPELWNTRADWDNYYAGPVAIFPNTKSKAKLINRSLGLFKISGASTHFVLVHKESCKKILNKLASLETIPIIDMFYKNNMRTLTSVPYIAIQKPGMSNIQNKKGTEYTDFTEEFNKSEQQLIAAL